MFFLQNIKILLCPQPCSSNKSFSSSQLSLLKELYAFFNFLLSLFSSNCCHLASISMTPIKSFSTVISFFAKFSGQFCVLLFLSLYHVTFCLHSFGRLALAISFSLSNRSFLCLSRFLILYLFLKYWCSSILPLASFYQTSLSISLPVLSPSIDSQCFPTTLLLLSLEF